MKVIKEIVNTLSKKKLRPVETIHLSGDKEGRYNTFYHLLLQNEINTDEEAASELFGEEKNSKRYLMFKSRFRNRLINHLFFLYDSEVVSQAAKDKILAYRNIFLANVLITLSANNSAYFFVRKSLSAIQKNQWYDLYLSALKIKIVEATFKNKYKEIERLSKVVYETTLIFSSESISYVLYEQCRSIIRNKKVLKKAEIQELEKLIEELQLLATKDNASFQTKWNALLIQLSYLSYLRNYKQVLYEIETIEIFLTNNNHFYNNARKYFLGLFKLESYAQLKQFTQGEKEIQKIDSIFSKGKLSWFTLQKYKFLLYMAQAKYQEALYCLSDAMKNKNFKNLSNNFIEQWKIWQAYLYVLYQSKNEMPELLIEKKFRIKRFLNEIHNSHYDKMGLNASLIILVFLDALKNKDYDSIMDRDHANQEYSRRHLKTKDSLRIKIVFNVMHKISNKLTNKKIDLKFIALAKEKLNKTTETYGEHSAVEIIPFQKVLDLIVFLLK